MFVVIAESHYGDEYWGKGETPELAWQDLQDNYAVKKPNTLILESIQVFEQSEDIKPRMEFQVVFE
ncbi:hypothetical protein EBR96_06795 [bacterium]|nr:hypothetical protein [bacterium]